MVSGVQPTGMLHLGGYLGAFRQWTAAQHEAEAFFFVADLHALTVDHDPAALRSSTIGVATELLAAGLEPSVCTLFVQSHVPEHSQLAWLLECTAGTGELSRMTQFKDKSAGQDSVKVGLFTYPVLMAADVLLYEADLVPVGDDQRQHLELTRDLAARFNHRYGDTFKIPEAYLPPVAARVMDLQHPERKMSKSAASPQGTIELLDPPQAIERKVARAVTDAETEVRYDRGTKPDVSNLLELLSAATGRRPEELAPSYSRYGDLKKDVAAALVEMLRPIRERYAELSAEPSQVWAVLEAGAHRARSVATPMLERSYAAIGLAGRPPSPSDRSA